ncbi:MAG: hypothetical protein AB1646_24795 [Thermodesulfobacteriota bacterium]
MPHSGWVGSSIGTAPRESTWRCLAGAVLVLVSWASLSMAAANKPSQTCIDCHSWSEDLRAAASAHWGESPCSAQFSQCPAVKAWGLESCVIERLFLVIQRGIDQEKEGDPAWYDKARERLTHSWGIWEDVRAVRFRESVDTVREPLRVVKGGLTSLYRELTARRDRRRLHRALFLALPAGAILGAAAVAAFAWRRRIRRGAYPATAPASRHPGQ